MLADTQVGKRRVVARRGCATVAKSLRSPFTHFPSYILEVRVRITAVILIALLMVWIGLAAPTGASKKSAPTKAAPKKAATPTAKTTPAPKTGSAGSSKTAKRNTPTKSYVNNRKARPAPARYYGQNEPTPDRYREIQQALIERGYMRNDATGTWDASSMDALRRFQQDQNLEASGKLDSLSLIALGLGPKRTASVQARPQ
jgi:hypothetical protein